MVNIRTGIIALVCLALVAPAAIAQGNGSIQGRVAREDGTGLGGVSVVVNELGLAELTDTQGNFSFNAVPPGNYTVSFTLADKAVTDTGVEVASGAVTTLDKTVDWNISFIETITVYSASRNTERLVEAPSAITTISEVTIERESASGQLPQLLANSPGAEPTQSGVYDYNFNTRGFNSSLNRRVLVLVDGRDPSAPFLGSQEWATLPFALDELASLELVRGPGSALYGADAFNGVINMVTKSPRYNEGGKVKLTGGDLGTARIDFRYAGAFGNDWYGRVSAGYLESDDFTRSRNAGVEYAGVNPEPIPLVREDIELTYGSVRLDKYFGNDKVLSLDIGDAIAKGPVAVTGIGRVQINDSDRKYLRANFNTQHWNYLGYFNDRDADDQRSLSSGVPLYLDSQKFNFEVQGNADFGGGKGRVIGGVSYGEEEIDSVNPQGFQTLMFNPVDGDFTGVFGQLEYDFSDHWKLLLAARWDDSSLHDSVFSPRAALVYAINRNNTLRFNYGQAFQTPNYSEFFLRVPVAAPITATAPLEAGFCAPFGVTCGLDSIPVLALGNESVEVEEITALEIGYSGIFGGKAFLTIDYYENELENFLTDLITSFNPTLGRINPNFGPYQAPSGLPAPVAAALVATLQGALGPSFALLSNDPFNETALLNAVSYTNFGQVDTQGLEVGLNLYLNSQWVLDANYSWFDFDVKNQIAADPLLPNTAENRYGVGITYNGSKFNGSAKWRHSDEYAWSAGVFQGFVPSYDVVDLVAGFRINDRIEVGLNVTNLFDDKHFEIFGGDILERRALAHIGFSF